MCIFLIFYKLCFFDFSKSSWIFWKLDCIAWICISNFLFMSSELNSSSTFSRGGWAETFLLLIGSSLGQIFSMKLTHSLDSDFSPESSWNNNHFCVNFWQNNANSQNDNFFHSKLSWVKKSLRFQLLFCEFAQFCQLSQWTLSQPYSNLSQVRQSI